MVRQTENYRKRDGTVRAPREGHRDVPSSVPRTHHLQQADVLPQGAHAAAEGDEEGEDAHHDEEHGGFHRQARHGRLCHGELSPARPARPPPPSPARHPGLTCVLQQPGVDPHGHQHHGDHLRGDRGEPEGVTTPVSHPCPHLQPPGARDANGAALLSCLSFPLSHRCPPCPLLLGGHLCPHPLRGHPPASAVPLRVAGHRDVVYQKRETSSKIGLQTRK